MTRKYYSLRFSFSCQFAKLLSTFAENDHDRHAIHRFWAFCFTAASPAFCQFMPAFHQIIDVAVIVLLPRGDSAIAPRDNNDCRQSEILRDDNVPA